MLAGMPWALTECHLLWDQNSEPNALASGFVRENIAPQSPRLAPSAQSTWHWALAHEGDPMKLRQTLLAHRVEICQQPTYPSASPTALKW